MSAQLGHKFGSILRKEFGILSKGEQPHRPRVAYDIVRKYSLMINTDLLEYNVVGGIFVDKSH